MTENKDSFAKTLIELGAISTFDPKRLSNATLKSMMSHIRLLQRNNIRLEESTFQDNTNRIINQLRDSHNKALSSNYKRQIAITIKRIFTNSQINFNEFSDERSRKKQTRLAEPNFHESIKKLIDRASIIIKDTYNVRKVEDLGLYDTCLAILLTISTSLRINELLQLRLTDVPIILKDGVISIRSKGGYQVRTIAKNEILIALFKTIQLQRDKVKHYIIERITDRTQETQKQRYDLGYLLITSEDYMRKKLHELASSLSITTQPLGFNSFRKFIVTMLIDGGGHRVAQSMNNHQSINTTMDNYNVVGPELVETTFSSFIDRNVANNNNNNNDVVTDTATNNTNNNYDVRQSSVFDTPVPSVRSDFKYK